MPRKRTYEEMEATDPVVSPEPSLLTKIRNMWEFAATMQYIFMFGKAVRIDEDFDIEVSRCTLSRGLAVCGHLINRTGHVKEMIDNFLQDFETECLRPGSSQKMEEIGLQLLKWISSHRGLKYAELDLSNVLHCPDSL